MVLNGGISATNPPRASSIGASPAHIVRWTLLVLPNVAGACLAEIPSSKVAPGPLLPEVGVSAASPGPAAPAGLPVGAGGSAAAPCPGAAPPRRDKLPFPSRAQSPGKHQACAGLLSPQTSPPALGGLLAAGTPLFPVLRCLYPSELPGAGDWPWIAMLCLQHPAPVQASIPVLWDREKGSRPW